MENLKLTEKELSYITESLLFSIGCDVCANWDKNDVEFLFDIAKKIKQNNQNLDIKNVYIHNPLLEDKPLFFDETTPRIIESFPEILKEDIV
jgi:hypothetical protein